MTALEREALREEWRGRVASYRESGMRVAAWCREHRIVEHQMRYWLERYPVDERAASPNSSWIALALGSEAPPKAGAGLLVHVGRASIEVLPGFDRALLADVLSVVKASC